MKKDTFEVKQSTIGYIFLGVGITLFLLNLTSVIEFMIFINSNNITTPIPMSGFYISVISSIIVMTYSLFNIYSEKE